MRLHIKRNQASGMLGGVKFELTGLVELTPEEAELVKRYKAEKEVLLHKEIHIPFTSKKWVMNLTIGSLTSGQKFKCEDIGEILATEKELRESCGTFKTYLEVMKHFGGEDIVDF